MYHFSLVKYLSLGIETVIIHLSSGYAVELHAREIKLGRDEAYTIEAQQSQGQEGIERVEAGWRFRQRPKNCEEARLDRAWRR